MDRQDGTDNSADGSMSLTEHHGTLVGHVSENPFLNSHGLCFLSLDGGGVRGLSTLYILKDIMDRINCARSGCNPPQEQLKPCDIFDLIGGTSTGGLIAIMLGRLEMTVDECIEEYKALMEQVFGKKANFIPLDLGTMKPKARYCSKRLKKAIMDVLKKKKIGVDELFNDERTHACKVFVCTTTTDEMKVQLLRSYTPNTYDSFSPKGVKIYEAALATSAATTYFDPVSIGKHELVDGALGANNPIEELEREAERIWCNIAQSDSLTNGQHPAELKQLVKCILSVGTGKPVQKRMDGNIIQVFKTVIKQSTAPDPAERRFYERWKAHSKSMRLFRFNVSGLEGVKLDEYKKQDVIESLTNRYLRDPESNNSLENCAINLMQKQGKAGFSQIHQIKEFHSKIRKSHWQHSITPSRSSSTSVRARAITNGERKSKNVAIHKEDTGEDLLATQVIDTIVVKDVSEVSDLPSVRPALSANNDLESSASESAALRHNLPFRRNENFVGRDTHFQELDKRVLCSGKYQTRLAILGLGGAGKTQVVLEYAYRLQEKHPGIVVIWIPVTTPETVNQAYNEIYEKLAIENQNQGNRKQEKNKVKQCVRDYLDRLKTPWLLIFDNVDDTDAWAASCSGEGADLLIRTYLPTSATGTILFTTRSRSIAVDLAKNNLVEVGALGEQMAVKLLTGALTTPSMDCDSSGVEMIYSHASALVEKLAYLPLAIVQAAAYLTTNGMSIEEYTSLLENDDSTQSKFVHLLSKDFEDEGRYPNTKNPIVTTWIVSFEKIQKTKPHAAQILEHLSLLNHRDIPESLFPLPENCSSPNLDLEQKDCIGVLTGYSFLTRRKNGNYDMHRLVHLATKNWLKTLRFQNDDSEYQRWEWTTKALCMFEKAFPSVDAYYCDLLPDVRSFYLPQLKCLLDSTSPTTFQISRKFIVSSDLDRLKLQLTLADYLRHEGMHDDGGEICRELFKRACEFNEDGSQHTTGARLQFTKDLARTLVDREAVEQAKILCLRILQPGEKTVTETGSSPLSATALLSRFMERGHKETLLNLLEAQREYEQAISLNRELLDLSIKERGLKDSDTIEFMFRLAKSLENLKKSEEAESIYRQLTELCVEIYGSENSTTISAKFCLLVCVLHSNREGTRIYEEAEQLCLQVREATRKMYGSKHPITRNAMSLSVEILNILGKCKEAEKAGRELLKILTKLEAPGSSDHRVALYALYHLTEAIRRQNRLEESLCHHEEQLQALQRAYGEDVVTKQDLSEYRSSQYLHWMTLIYNDAESCTISSYRAAENFFRDVWDYWKEKYGFDAHDTLNAMYHISLCLYLQGSSELFDTANDMLVNCNEMQERTLGSEHEDTKASLILLKKIKDERSTIAFAAGSHGDAITQSIIS